MKRCVRRVAAVLFGLGLGWYLAGMLPDPAVTLAQHAAVPDGAVEHDAAAQDHAAAEREHGAGAADAHDDAHGGEHEGGDHHGPDASGLVPEPEHAAFYEPMLWTIGGLFVAAILLGIPALRLRGPLPPDPAEALAHADDHAADHGHDHDHGH